MLQNEQSGLEGETMPLVHVHGIANRGAEDERRTALRDSWFRLALMPAAGCRSPETPILNPHWGALLPPPAWNWASLHVAGVESLGGDEAEIDDSVAEMVDGVAAAAPDVAEGRVLVTAARASLLWAVELLAASVEARSAEERDATVAFCARAVAYWARKTGDGRRGDGVEFFAWLGEVEADVDFLDRLDEELDAWQHELDESGGQKDVPDEWERFGGVSVPRPARAAVRRINAVFAKTVASGVMAVSRRFTPKGALLFADVAGYLAGRGSVEQPGPVVQLVGKALDDAARAVRAYDDPLIVVAHSMGGNIVHDVLSFYRPDVRVDLLVTVGTQVGLFEELKLFAASDPAVPSPQVAKVSRLPNVTRWINVVDVRDLLAFVVGPVFAGAEDLVFDSGALLPHGAYLTSPDFHRRLARRVAEGVRS
ncbi:MULTISPECIES: esterase/lipase family protein [unclassified Streptomyces]|uniref:esterase/lipase family protein n=1 Tax=unclassified Streptomyces TaxID=2593676 RepID=UPI00403C881E